MYGKILFDDIYNLFELKVLIAQNDFNVLKLIHFWMIFISLLKDVELYLLNVKINS